MLTKKEGARAHTQYLGERQLAARWGVSAAKLQADRHFGRGAPFVKLGSTIRYRLNDVEAYERRMLVDPTNSVVGGGQ